MEQLNDIEITNYINASNYIKTLLELYIQNYNNIIIENINNNNNTELLMTFYLIYYICNSYH